MTIWGPCHVQEWSHVKSLLSSLHTNTSAYRAPFSGNGAKGYAADGHVTDERWALNRIL